MLSPQELLISLGLLTLIYLPLELAFPAHRQGLWRRGTATDLAFWFGQTALWTAPIVALLTVFVGWSDQLPLADVRSFFGGWPLWAQILAVIALCDVGIYWAHRLSHSNPFLWRFHKVHHTSERLDFLAAYREHPIDNLFTRTVENAPAILLGFPLEVLAGFAVFRGLWAIYIHSNVRLTPGPLRYVLGAPRLHHWHHEVAHHSRVNFANLSPLMDLAFGTYYDPGRMPERYGLGNKRPPGFAVQLIEPLLPRAWGRRLVRGGRKAA